MLRRVHAGKSNVGRNTHRVPCRLAFAHMADKCRSLMQYIVQQGPEAVLDMDELLLREAMDVMGGRT
jgi:hypothetical protein